MPSWPLLLALCAPGFAEPGDLPADPAAEPGNDEAPAPDENTPLPASPDGVESVPAPVPNAPSDPTPSETGATEPPPGETVSSEKPLQTAAQPLSRPKLDPPAMAVLKGKVLERGSGKPVAGARISSGEHTAIVKPDGTFLLPLPPGRRAVVIQSDEHIERANMEELWPGDALTVVYRVERWAWGREVVVYGDKLREEISRTVLTAEELRLVPGAFGDPIRALQSLPSVARPSTLEGDLVVRGAEGSNTATYIDMVPVPYLFHFFVGRSVVNPSMLDDVEFFAGGMPTRFGNVTQAVVNARTAERPIERGVHGTVSVDLLDFAASAEGRIKDRITWEAAVRESWVGGLIGASTRAIAAARGNGDTVPGWAAPNYFDYSTRLRVEAGQDQFTLSLFGAADAFVLHPARDLLEEPDPVELRLPFDPNKPLYAGFHRLHGRWDPRPRATYSRVWASSRTAPTSGRCVPGPSCSVETTAWSWVLA